MIIFVMPNPRRTVNGQPLQVRDPISGQYIPAAGKAVPRSAYWIRRLRAKDVVTGAPEAPAAPAPATDSGEGKAAGTGTPAPAASPTTAPKTGPVLFADAVAQLDHNNPQLWTGAGKPDCRALSTIMGRTVTAAERDREWAALQEVK